MFIGKYYQKSEVVQGSYSSVECRIYKEPRTLYERMVVGNTGEKPIYSYTRNYPSVTFANNTFAPFKRKDGKEYALVSDSYSKISVLDLETINFVGSTGKHNEFCLTHVYVPHFYEWEMDWGENKMERYEIENEFWHPSESTEDIGAKDHVGNELNFYAANYAFVAGCVWGDDPTWKIQLLDLRDLENLKIVPSFGYLEMPRHCKKLEDLIHIPVFDGTIDPEELKIVEINGNTYKFDKNWKLEDFRLADRPLQYTPEEFDNWQKEVYERKTKQI